MKTDCDLVRSALALGVARPDAELLLEKHPFGLEKGAELDVVRVKDAQKALEGLSEPGQKAVQTAMDATGCSLEGGILLYALVTHAMNQMEDAGWDSSEFEAVIWRSALFTEDRGDFEESILFATIQTTAGDVPLPALLRSSVLPDVYYVLPSEAFRVESTLQTYLFGSDLVGDA